MGKAVFPAMAQSLGTQVQELANIYYKYMYVQYLAEPLFVILLEATCHRNPGWLELTRLRIKLLGLFQWWQHPTC